MKEDINFRIIKKLNRRKYEKRISDFLIAAIREEFQRREQKRWNFKEIYDSLIEQYALQKESER